MHKRVQTKRTATSLLLLFAMLIVSVAVYFPTVVSSAGNEPPERLMCMYPYPSQSIEDNSITLRFAFTINSSFNGNVGIVYSFSNQNPTFGGSNCFSSAATVYYPWQAITWHSTPLTPGIGRKWAMGETGTILKAQYSDSIYVRAYVSDANGTAYSEVLVTSVEETFLKDWNESFHSSDFGGSTITSSFAHSYNPTPVTPTVGQHPRVLFNASNIAGINRALTNGKNTAAANAYLEAVSNPTNGILSPAAQHDDGFHNFDQKKLSDIMALALDYQLSGSTLSGYRAIYAAKNYLTTMDFDDLVTENRVDFERYYGLVIYTMACVYDWCHDLMTLLDKTQIVAGVQHKCCEGGRMEIGFPPSLQSSVTDHGSEYQLLRDYLAFAIAIYDEYPGWWDFVAGRFYQEFVPVRNEFYVAGMVPQGTSQYVQIRFASDLYSALLIKAATGTFPYASQSNMQQVMRTVYEYELMKTPAGTNGKMMFGSGDGSYANKKLPNYGLCSLIASHLFNDRNARAFLESDLFGGACYSQFSVGFFQCSPAEELICSSGEVQAYSNRHQGLSPIVYNGGWLGQIIAHDSWSGSKQAATLMKIGVRSAAGHEHQDAGQFQIFYKGILAGDSGVYSTYNSNHHKYYHQATVAHNSLLIYNPSHSSDNKGYYSGGQRVLTEPQNLQNWQNGWYDTGTVTGYRYDAPNWWEANYAYIAGDITPAYDSDTVTEVNRRMLTVFDTDDASVPMLFFVYDNITATSGSFKKTFLLHTVNEPTVSGNKVTVTNGEGRLVLQNLFGGNSITKRGGGWDDGSGTQGKNYYVNKNGANNYVRLLPNRDYDDGYWGRVEISPNTGSANDQLLNAMYVCDTANDPNLTATSFSTSVVKGAVLCNTVAVFVCSSTPRTTSFSFNPSSSGTKTFYVSGVANGNWTVKCNGTTVGTYQAEGGLLVFEAQTGNIELVK
ncbi:MAG: heparinase II/III family protein [Clostridia bacterium]|nr:heparinase II/III family protein [Clostridia bacterium]